MNNQLAEPSTMSPIATSSKSDTTDTNERNKKWKAYALISISSFTNFLSLADVWGVTTAQNFFSLGNNVKVNMMFGILTFLLSLFILILDQVSFIRTKFDFKGLKNGKVEGWTLLSFVIWWIAGVSVTTRAGGIAYKELNIYFSSWATLFACVYALDMWGSEKNMLTIHEMIRLSLTLPGWWVVFFSSIVTFGSAADAGRIVQTDSAKSSCSFAVGVGIVSTIISSFFILSHYEFLQCCEACTSWLTYGGWLELSFSLTINFWLIIGLDQVTGAGKIASTITGNGLDPMNAEYVPGSNIYFSIWLTFLSSCIVTMRWKEARAIKFAQTAEGQTNLEDGIVLDNDDESDVDI